MIYSSLYIPKKKYESPVFAMVGPGAQVQGGREWSHEKRAKLCWKKTLKFGLGLVIESNQRSKAASRREERVF